MKLASSSLILEHEMILVSLRVLDVIADRLESGKDIPVEDIKAPVSFLKIFVDKYHHCKEECVLFPALVESGVHDQNGPIGMMLYEHEKGREYLLKMEDSLSATPVKRSDFIESARGYITMMRNNIKNENSVLFPISDVKIPPSKQEIIIKNFEDIEREGIGDETVEKLSDLLNDFKRMYLM